MSLATQAQKTLHNLSKKSKSVYTFSLFSNDENSFSAINKKLKLSGFNFVFVDGLELELNRFTINTENFGRHPSKFIYDDYKRYQDRNLLKYFLLKNDLTRWNLQCPQQNMQL